MGDSGFMNHDSLFMIIFFGRLWYCRSRAAPYLDWIWIHVEWSLMELRGEMKESHYQVHVSHRGFNADPASTTVFGWMMCRARVLTAPIELKIAWGRRFNGYGWSSFLFLSIDGSAEAEHVFINFFSSCGKATYHTQEKKFSLRIFYHKFHFMSFFAKCLEMQD